MKTCEYTYYHNLSPFGTAGIMELGRNELGREVQYRSKKLELMKNDVQYSARIKGQTHCTGAMWWENRTRAKWHCKLCEVHGLSSVRLGLWKWLIMDITKEVESHGALTDVTNRWSGHSPGFISIVMYSSIRWCSSLSLNTKACIITTLHAYVGVQTIALIDLLGGISTIICLVCLIYLNGSLP